MEILELAGVFTAAGALAWAGVIIFAVELLKRLSPLAETGRAPMYAAASLGAIIVALAAWDVSATGALGLNTPNFIVALAFAWLNVTAAAIGLHTTAMKAGRVIQGTTNTSGPDTERG